MAKIRRRKRADDGFDDDLKRDIIALLGNNSKSGMQWIAPSPFQIVEFKQIMRRVFRVGGQERYDFLGNLGIKRAADLDAINEVSAPTLIMLLCEAYTIVGTLP